MRFILPPALMLDTCALVEPSTELLRVLLPYKPALTEPSALALAPAVALASMLKPPALALAPACAEALPLASKYKPAEVSLLLRLTSCTSCASSKLMSAACRSISAPDSSDEPTVLIPSLALIFILPPDLMADALCVMSSVSSVDLLTFTKAKRFSLLASPEASAEAEALAPVIPALAPAPAPTLPLALLVLSPIKPTLVVELVLELVFLFCPANTFTLVASISTSPPAASSEPRRFTSPPVLAFKLPPKLTLLPTPRTSSSVWVSTVFCANTKPPEEVFSAEPEAPADAPAAALTPPALAPALASFLPSALPLS